MNTILSMLLAVACLAQSDLSPSLPAVAERAGFERETGNQVSTVDGEQHLSITYFRSSDGARLDLWLTVCKDRGVPEQIVGAVGRYAQPDQRFREQTVRKPLIPARQRVWTAGRENSPITTLWVVESRCLVRIGFDRMSTQGPNITDEDRAYVAELASNILDRLTYMGLTDRDPTSVDPERKREVDARRS